MTKFEGQQVIWKYFLSCENNSRSFKSFIDKLENDQASCKKIRIEVKTSCTLYQIIPIKFDHEANVGPIQINLHRFDLSWKRQWNQNIVIFLLPASVSITMMLFLLYLWHRITFWRWRAAVSFCHEIAFWGLSTSLSFRILLQRLLLQDLEHATFSARKQGKEYYICTFP